MYLETLIVLVIIIVWEVIKKTYHAYIHGRFTDVFSDYLYLDANATTPIYPQALAAYCKYTTVGNASTTYAARIGDISLLMEESNSLISDWLSLTDHKIIWNSGASEGNNYVIRTIADIGCDTGALPHIIASSIEHKTSLSCLEQLSQAGKIQYTLIQPDMYGCIDPVSVAHVIKPNTKLITIMHTNNELGSVNPIQLIGEVAAKYNCMFHVDAAQALGKCRIDIPGCHIDALTASSHKFYGPTGTGLLILSSRFVNRPQITGMQFEGLRGGTENIPCIAASTVALKETWANRVDKNIKLHKLKRRIVSALDKEFGLIPFSELYNQPDSCRYGKELELKVIVLGETDSTLTYPSMQASPNTLLLSVVKTGAYDDNMRFCNINLKQALLDRKIIISIGSACNTGKTGPSHVLQAIKAPYIVRSGTFRISLMDTSDASDVQKLITNLITCINLQK